MSRVKKASDEHEVQFQPKKSKSCDGAEILEKVLNVLDSFTETTSLTQEVRKLE